LTKYFVRNEPILSILLRDFLMKSFDPDQLHKAFQLDAIRCKHNIRWNFQYTGK